MVIGRNDHKEAWGYLKQSLADTRDSLEEYLPELNPRSHAAIETRGQLREVKKTLKLMDCFLRGIRRMKNEKRRKS